MQRVRDAMDSDDDDDRAGPGTRVRESSDRVD